MKTRVPSIDMKGVPADARVTRAQIGAGALMNLGARDYVRDDPNGMLMFRIGSKRLVRKAIIVLNGSDLYDVEIGRLDRKTLDWVTEATRRDVFADQLAEALLQMHGEVS